VEFSFLPPAMTPFSLGDLRLVFLLSGTLNVAQNGDLTLAPQNEGLDFFPYKSSLCNQSGLSSPFLIVGLRDLIFFFNGDRTLFFPLFFPIILTSILFDVKFPFLPGPVLLSVTPPFSRCSLNRSSMQFYDAPSPSVNGPSLTLR